MPTPPRSSRVPASTTRAESRRGAAAPGRPRIRRVPRTAEEAALGPADGDRAVGGGVLLSRIGHAVLSGLDSDISRFDAFKDMKNRPRAGDGMNVLMVGTDGRDEITEEERRKYRLGGAPCHCTDTIMIVHISEDRERASVVSLPRDSYAVTPGHTDRTTGEHHEGHPLKLNAAYAEGGPQLTIRTVENMTRVKIDHYLEVDFTSFMKTVDVLGGVKICTVKPLKDNYTGLDLPAGTHTLRGGQALQYVRARHLDGASDLSRMKRQQRFLAALIDRATSSGILLNPLKFRDQPGPVLGSVRADQGFGTDELLTLGMGDAELLAVVLRVHHRADRTDGLRRQGRRFDPEVGPGEVRAALRRPARGQAAGRAETEAEGAAAGAGPGGPEADPRAGGERHPDLRAWQAGGRRAGRDRLPHHQGTEERRRPGGRADRRRVADDPRWDQSAKSLAAALPGSELKPVKGQGATLKVIAGADFKNVAKVRPADPPQESGTVVRGDEVVCGKE
ncbi:LCP family protein [Streptomyces violaceorubidus]